MPVVEAGGQGVVRVFWHEPISHEALGYALAQFLAEVAAEEGLTGSPLVLCIGTDRSSGDSLGPLVGYFLQEEGYPWPILGTIHDPVHAVNLEEVLRDIRRFHSRRPVVAVDACLGRMETVGTIHCQKGPLWPGSGVRKSLPPVGHVSMTGTVNAGGVLDYVVLQTTRLSTVMRMARVMTRALWLAAALYGSSGQEGVAVTGPGR